MSEISKSKVQALAKPNHSRCLGRGIVGFRPGTNAAVFCPCIFRALRRRGVNTDQQADVARFLAPDPPKREEET